jgi:hypothetical protein
MIRKLEQYLNAGGRFPRSIPVDLLSLYQLVTTRELRALLGYAKLVDKDLNLVFQVINKEGPFAGITRTEKRRNLDQLARRILTWLRAIQEPIQRLEQERTSRMTAAQEPPTRSPKAKRSTEKGEGRAKLIAGLTKHHQYANGGCLNFEHIGNNKLAGLAKVDRATASAFFKKEFGSHLKYRAACNHGVRLAMALKLLNGEVRARSLFGANPPGEGGRKED